MKINELRYNIGLSLSIVGVTIGMLLNFIWPIVKWSPIIMLVSILLLINKDVFTPHCNGNRFFKAIVLFQLFMIIYAFTSDYSKPVLGKYLPYHLYILALSYILMKNRKLKNLDFLSTLFIITALLSIIGTIFTYYDLIRLDKLLRQEKAVLEVFTLNIAIYANFISGLCLLRRCGKWSNLIIFTFFLMDLYVIIRSGKRSYFVAVFLAIILYLHRHQSLIRGIAFGGILAFSSFAFIPQIRDASITIFNNTIEGFSTVYLSEDESYYYDENDSASIRRYNKKLVFKDLEENFTVFHVFFGMGYYYAYIDNPLFESFIDMGIIGLFLYCYIVLIIPFLFYKRIKGNDDFDLFFFLNSIVNITVIITNNNPYAYFVYTPICLIAMRSLDFSSKNKVNINRLYSNTI